MGVIYGYISLTNKPVDPEIAEAMRKANSFWDPDGDGLFISEYAALGSLILFNTPEAIFEKQPIYFASNNKVLVATARIDNRDELCRAFDIPLSARDIYPDSYYIRLAYEKWGEACLDHLIGDWSFAVYDKLTRKLFLARDHHGIMACYYYQGPDFFVFSSSLKGILCLPQVEKKVNEYKIAQLLVNWNEGGPQTCYQDIFRLPPAHTLSLEYGKSVTNRYWYLEHTPEIRLKNDQEYIDMFREIYTEAVRCRLRTYRPVGATLSGGLDSGSVCILAAKELAKYGKRLPAFTAVPLYDVPWPKNRIGDEGPLALALAEKLGNVDVTLCRAENISVLEGINIMMNVHDQPGFAVGNAYWIADILTKCNRKNYGTLLIGQGGNGTVSWPPNSLLNYNPETYKNILRRWKKNFEFLSGKWKKDLIINNELLQKYRFNDLLKKAKVRRYFPQKFTKEEIRLDIIRPGSYKIGDVWCEIGNFFKMEIRDPTMDFRILSFLMGIPQEKGFRNNRELFKNYFFESISLDVINGIKRGRQSIDITKRIENELPYLERDFLKESAENNRFYSFASLKKISDFLKRKNDFIKIKTLLKLVMIKKFMIQLNTLHHHQH